MWTMIENTKISSQTILSQISLLQAERKNCIKRVWVVIHVQSESI